jgi:phosphoribosylaminoimidazolecarboxamide formyltransferase/IMP cyclohydrolase
MVVCNLYNFADAAAKADSVDDLIEEMDIGGSALIRSAVKNHSSVAVVVDPADYSSLLEELKQGALSLETRRSLAVKAINLSADYDAMIAEELTRRLASTETRRPRFIGGEKLRYGENPDQEGWIYRFPEKSGIAHAEVLGGKQLSYNNYDDATVAFHAAEAIRDLAPHGVAIIKHGNLCGYAAGADLGEVFESAWEGDPKSAFGSIIALTSEANADLTSHLKGRFIEVIIAPGFSDEFVEWAKRAKPNLRLLKTPQKGTPAWVYKTVSGGILAQTPKTPRLNGHQVVTKRQPASNQKPLFAFAIAAVHFGKSNAIAIVRERKPGLYQLLAMGSGQPNRVDSLQRLAIPKAYENLEREGSSADLSACVLASDGFFPFDDSVRCAAQHGIRTCIQPGGSNNDPVVIEAADELEMCMIFTGERYFTH